MTKVEKRLKDLERWVADFQEGNDESLVFNNINFLINQLKALGDRLTETEQSHVQLQQAIAANNNVVSTFIEDNELEESWEEHLKALQEDLDATQEGEESEDN
tara:strand:- start:369 stop:677 length:309 start_codon:yes stop_codon:yes gene_type:complete